MQRFDLWGMTSMEMMSRSVSFSVNRRITITRTGEGGDGEFAEAGETVERLFNFLIGGPHRTGPIGGAR